jgi:dsDNA-binding SOS-regulon protein
MSVEIRYHVIRNGKEVAMYTTKKEADAHDKMLDIAERLTDFIQAAESFDVEESVLEELALYLARNRMDAIQILKGAKPKASEPKAASEPAATSPPQKASPPKPSAKKGGRKKR